MSQEEGKKGSLRAVMPVAAEIVDWLREQLGKQAADAIVLKGKAGRGGFYVAEIGPDGVFREFGSTKGGRRCELRKGRVVWQGDGNALPGSATVDTSPHRGVTDRAAALQREHPKWSAVRCMQAAKAHQAYLEQHHGT